MNDLERIRAWLKEWPGAARLAALRCDYTDQAADNGGLFPTGVRELERRYDLLGRSRVRCEARFVLFLVLKKAPGDDAGATENAAWLLDLQRWVLAQSLAHLTPTFGDEPGSETMKAQNGALYDADDEGTATYRLELCAGFVKRQEE